MSAQQESKPSHQCPQAAETVRRLRAAVACHAAGRTAEALAIAGELTSATLPEPHHYQLLGGLLAKLGCHEPALEVYARLTALEPLNANHHYNLATINRFLGRFDAAESACNRALEINPLDTESIMLRSDLRTQRTQDNHVAGLRETLALRSLGWRGRVQVLHALAKELEDLGEYRAAFASLKQGADLRRRHMQYDVANDEAAVDQIIEVFDEAVFHAPVAGDDSDEPIFIIGLPRTGTTLIERILGRHSAIHSMGELDHFARAVIAAAAGSIPARARSRAALIQASAKLDFSRVGRAYVDSTRPHTGHTRHFVDKLPLNFLYAGLIHLALPNARIVHVIRHPIDACYAIYKRLFRNAYPYSYDLEELGRYYVAYHRLMAHWQRVMPGIIYDLHYEQLVEDTRDEVASVLGHLGLDFEDDCLTFNESQAASTTASASQVRQPIYSSSIGRWRLHEAALAPVARRLESAGVLAEYETLTARATSRR